MLCRSLKNLDKLDKAKGKKQKEYKEKVIAKATFCYITKKVAIAPPKLTSFFRATESAPLPFFLLF